MAADDSVLRLRIREITETCVHYGYRRAHILLKQEGWQDNHKRIYSIYREQRLSLRLKRPHRNKSTQRHHSLRGFIRTMSGAWILSLMLCLQPPVVSVDDD